ncbi:MAG: hypothetical protein P8186_30995, partial [Anaerolineae bacterium]
LLAPPFDRMAGLTILDSADRLDEPWSRRHDRNGPFTAASLSVGSNRNKPGRCWKKPVLRSRRFMETLTVARSVRTRPSKSGLPVGPLMSK